jgi:hypothetical protein
MEMKNASPGGGYAYLNGELFTSEEKRNISFY